MKHAATMIAESLNLDVTDIRKSRYQRYANPSVYSVGDRYFAASFSKPKHEVGREWKPYKDQFGARGTNTTIWVCEMEATK